MKDTSPIKTLASLAAGRCASIKSFLGATPTVQRLLEMGLTAGTTAKIIRFAPFGCPIQLRVRGYNLSVRRSDAAAIEIDPESIT